MSSSRATGRELPSTRGRALDPEPLGRLLVIQGCFQLVDDEDTLFSMITRGLGWLPGIASASVRLGDPGDEAPTASASHTAVPIGTLHQHFGRLEIELSHRERYLPYEPFVRNLAGTIALWLENQQRRHLLEQTLDRLKVALSERSHALEKSRAAVRVRENILAIVSHDLRNPLSAITNAVAMLQRTASDERTHGLLDIVDRSSSRMSRMIRDLLDLASIDAGRLSMEARPNDVRDLVTEAVEESRPVAARKEIALDVHAASDLPRVVCDGQRIVQVLANLVGNALKFTPGGGSVTVRAERGHGGVVLSVEDSGPGIPEEDLPHIFDRFYRSKRTREEGKGLGLAIAKGIVGAHGGTLVAESAPGRGSKFIVTLPTGSVVRTPSTE